MNQFTNIKNRLVFAPYNLSPAFQISDIISVYNTSWKIMSQVKYTQAVKHITIQQYIASDNINWFLNPKTILFCPQQTQELLDIRQWM